MDKKCGLSPTLTTTISRVRLRNHISWPAYRDRPVPDAKVAIYPFKREFVVGVSSTDVQSATSRCATCPGWKLPSVNAGTSIWERSTTFFTTEAMVKMSEVGHM